MSTRRIGDGGDGDLDVDDDGVDDGADDGCENKTISDGGITVDFSIIKVPTSN